MVVDSHTTTIGFDKSADALLIGYVIAVVTFLFGYCIYFKYIYRDDANKRNFYKRRRRKDNNNSHYALEYVSAELKNCSLFGCHFIREIQLFQMQFINGDPKRGVVHLANALAWSEQPRQLLEVMRITLPSSIYKMLVNEILDPVMLNEHARALKAMPSGTN